MLVRVHLILRQPNFQRRIRRLLPGPTVVHVTAEVAQWDVAAALARQTCDLVIVREELLPTDVATLTRGASDVTDRPKLLVITRSRDPERRSALLAVGIDHVLGENDPDDVLRRALQEIVEQRGRDMLLGLRARAAERHGSFADFVANSPRMTRFVDVVRRVIDVSTSVLILGETGVGKERLARIIHAEGPRRGGPFVAVHCAALPDHLLESELFGHERGAFTDAVRDKRGKFELAHGGTIFLDEIGEMPFHLQVKLLRVLQEREVERIGSETPLPVDVRVLSATHVDLERAVHEGRFRADLYYRLSVVTLEIPPLRERLEDVPDLVARFLAQFEASLGSPPRAFSPRAIEALCRYDWPGNVRELINVVERAVLLARGTRIELEDLPANIASSLEGSSPSEEATIESAASHPFGELDADALLRLPLAEARTQAIAHVERWYLENVMRTTEGRIGETARRVGIDPRSLYDKLKRYGIDKRDYKG
ncbi:MAG: sigma-54-dependent Fis family transcriptional regulator [Planctomycetes bacterium]|nr:sigma-54-dependent Fis family transcriptional regulator [Planctomycetota bacterium]